MKKTTLTPSFEQFVSKLNEYEDNRPHYGQIDSEDFKMNGIKELEYKDLEEMKSRAVVELKRAIRWIDKIEKEIELQGESQDEAVLKLIDIKYKIIELYSDFKSTKESHIDTGF